jgi:hypothetical protein
VAIDRLGERTINSIGVGDCKSVVADAVERARGKRPGTAGRSARENCFGALRALFVRAERAGVGPRIRLQGWGSSAAFPIGVAPSKTKRCAN